MDRISRIKTDLLMREWAEMVRECRSSGFTVKEWCDNNGVNIKTYYYRLKRVRDFICDSKLENNMDSSDLSVRQDIVPLPMGNKSDNDAQQIRIASANISLELPVTVSPQLLKAAIEVLKC